MQPALTPPSMFENVTLLNFFRGFARMLADHAPFSFSLLVVPAIGWLSQVLFGGFVDSPALANATGLLENYFLAMVNGAIPVLTAAVGCTLLLLIASVCDKGAS